MTSRILIASLAILTAFSAIAPGQVPANPDSSLQAILGQFKGTPLRLREAIAYGSKNATSVRKAEAAYLAALGSTRRESGQFDPTLFFNLNYLDQQQPTASFFAGAATLATQQTVSRAGLRMSLPIGTQLELGLNTVKLNTNSAFAFLNPEYDAFGSLTLRQPLLGGFLASGRKQLTKSERDLDAAKARYDQALLTIETDVEHSYWDLYAAQRDYAVQKLTRDRAEAFLKETELRARTGIVGPNQVANARTFLSQQTLRLLEREEQADRQSDQLASLIGVRPEPGTLRFIPTDEPASDYPVDSVEALVDAALKSNLDIQASQEDVEAQRTLANAAGWEALPSINLVGSLGGNGLSGTPQDVTFNDSTYRTTKSGTWGDALSQTVKRQFPNWSIGVEVNIPIGFRGGLGEKDRLDANVLAAEQRSIELERMLADQVRATHRELANGIRRLRAAREGVEAAQEQVRIGLIEFQNGRTTAFELTRLGEDYAASQQQYSAALVRTAKAAASLRQLTSGRYQPNH